MARALSEDFHCKESHEPDLARGLPEHFAMYIYSVTCFSDITYLHYCYHLCSLTLHLCDINIFYTIHDVIITSKLKIL